MELVDLLEHLDDEQRLRIYERFGRLVIQGVREAIIGHGALVEHQPPDASSRRLYLTTPTLSFGHYGQADGIFLRAEVGRATAEEILRLLDEHEL